MLNDIITHKVYSITINTDVGQITIIPDSLQNTSLTITRESDYFSFEKSTFSIEGNLAQLITIH